MPLEDGVLPSDANIFGQCGKRASMAGGRSSRIALTIATYRSSRAAVHFEQPACNSITPVIKVSGLSDYSDRRTCESPDWGPIGIRNGDDGGPRITQAPPQMGPTTSRSNGQSTVPLQELAIFRTFASCGLAVPAVGRRSWGDFPTEGAGAMRHSAAGGRWSSTGSGTGSEDEMSKPRKVPT